VFIGGFLVLLVLVCLLTNNIYKPKGFHGWPAAFVIFAVAAVIVVTRPQWQTMLQSTTAYGASPHSAASVTPATAITDTTPGLSAAFLDRILAAHHSPAHGLGTVFVAQGQQYHIDPLYALGFFDEESKYGVVGWAVRTHSLGNIRCTVGWSECLGGYRAYATWTAGITDWFTIIHDVYLAHGRTTLASILPVYAPAGDLNNDPNVYIHVVCQDVNMWRQGKVG
jgi:hypothetical protein